MDVGGQRNPKITHGTGLRRGEAKRAKDEANAAMLRCQDQLEQKLDTHRKETKKSLGDIAAMCKRTKDQSVIDHNEVESLINDHQSAELGLDIHATANVQDLPRRLKDQASVDFALLCVLTHTEKHGLQGKLIKN